MEHCLRLTYGLVGDFVVACWDGVQVRDEWCSSECVVFCTSSACFWEGSGGIARLFLLRGALFSTYLSKAILPLDNWRRSDSVSHAPLHATLNGMERIGMSPSPGWTLVR